MFETLCPTWSTTWPEPSALWPTSLLPMSASDGRPTAVPCARTVLQKGTHKLYMRGGRDAPSSQQGCRSRDGSGKDRQLDTVAYLKRSWFLRSESYTGVSAMWIPLYSSAAQARRECWKTLSAVAHVLCITFTACTPGSLTFLVEAKAIQDADHDLRGKRATCDAREVNRQCGTTLH